ncbi:hypothetical protein Tco_0475704 [Tanacetum coccineum]
MRTRRSKVRTVTPFANPERQFQTRREVSPAPIHNIYSFYEYESSESDSENVDIETLTLEQYLALDLNNTRKRSTFLDNSTFEVKGQLLRELRKISFSGVKAITTMDKENMKEPVPSDLPPTPFLGHLKEQMGSPYSTRETIHMIRNPEEIHNAKAHREEGDMDVGWDISSKDVERLRQFLTPTIHTLPNLEPVVQPYIPLGPVHDKDKIVREKEQDYDIPLNDSVMQPLTPQTVHITPPDDDYVAPATNPMSNKQLNKSEEEFSHITKVYKK